MAAPVAVPSQEPAQLMAVEETVALSAMGSDMMAESVAVQPLASVSVTVCTPAHKLTQDESEHPEGDHK